MDAPAAADRSRRPSCVARAATSALAGAAAEAADSTLAPGTIGTAGTTGPNGHGRARPAAPARALTWHVDEVHVDATALEAAPATAAPPRRERTLPRTGAELRAAFAHTHGSAFSLSGDGDVNTGVDVDLESAVELHVRPGVFMEFFMIQLLAPFSVPYTWVKYGWPAVRNMNLFCIPTHSGMQNNTRRSPTLAAMGIMYLSSWMLALATAIIWCTQHATLESQGISSAEPVMALMLFAVHKAMVAIKYATMTPGELKLFLKTSLERAIGCARRGARAVLPRALVHWASVASAR